MANNGTLNWRCRECLSGGITADLASASHMKSHLATHDYGPWRCTECNFIGLRKLTITTHQRRSGESAAAAYNDPALNARVNSEVRECLMPHRNTWTGRTALPSPNASALAVARAAIVHHSQTPMVAAAAPAMAQPPQSSINPTTTAMATTSTTTTTFATTTTTLITTLSTITNATTATPAEGDRPEPIASHTAPVTTSAIISLANQAIDIATPFIDHLNQMQDRSEEEHIQSCIICSRSSLNFRDSTP